MLVRIREGIQLADVQWTGMPEQLGVYLMDTADGLAVVDPGPTVCREALEAALGAMGATVGDLRHILLTHIHLDHAAVAGSLVRQVPGARVYVHSRGAPHLEDPSRLLASALRIYGDELATLFGEFGAIPRDRLVVLEGGERLSLGQRRIRVAATPGHAIHHVAYLDEGEGVAFTGDVGGEATQHGTPCLPVTPPPDIDLPAWRRSIDLIQDWRPEVLGVTHFGPVPAPQAHLEELWTRLVDWSEQVRVLVADTSRTDEEQASLFADAEWARLTSGLPEERAAWVDRRSIHSSYFGLARYWRRQVPTPATTPPT